MNIHIKKVLNKSKVLFIVIGLIFNVLLTAAADGSSNKKGIEQMHQWLIDNQLDNGALPMYGADDGEETLVSYFSTISTFGILAYKQDDKSLDAVRSYFDWYFSHLNYDAPNEIGTIYDYEVVIEDKKVISENSLNDYDSADSYAAVLLISLWRYIEAGGDIDYILKHQDDIIAITNLSISLIDESGLSAVSHSNGTKYLMDNCEVAMGLECAHNIINYVYLKQYGSLTKRYWEMLIKMYQLKRIRNNMVEVINTQLWNEENNWYEVGMNRNGTIIECDGYEDFYPDTTAQIFPIVFGLIEPDSDRAISIYNDICNVYDWEELSHYHNEDSGFYWGKMAYCAAMMGDTERVDEYIENYHEQVLPDLDYPAYNADISWVIMAATYE